jgi:hypothetical protein
LSNKDKEGTSLQKGGPGSNGIKNHEGGSAFVDLNLRLISLQFKPDLSDEIRMGAKSSSTEKPTSGRERKRS